MEKKYYIRTWIPVEPDEQELMTLEEAEKELEHLELLQPENIYKIEEVDEGPVNN